MVTRWNMKDCQKESLHDSKCYPGRSMMIHEKTVSNSPPPKLNSNGIPFACKNKVLNFLQVPLLFYNNEYKIIADTFNSMQRQLVTIVKKCRSLFLQGPQFVTCQITIWHANCSFSKYSQYSSFRPLLLP